MSKLNYSILHYSILGLALATWLLSPNGHAADTTQRFISPNTQVQLVELYTSQGCSSCPPADSWLSKYGNSPKLWQSVVPVAYHVDYWDYLGWRDPFAVAAHGSRQRQTAHRADSGVYTPGVFRNQQEWRSWRRPNSWFAAAAPPPQKVGVLAGELSAQQLKVTFTPADNRSLKGAQVELVTMRSKQTTQVRAGENHGRKLEHNFVAGPVRRAPLVWDNGVWVGQLTTGPTEDSEHSSALAFWVIDSQGDYLQATGGWLATEG